GRPFEGWTHAQIEERLGEIRYYVHDKLGWPLVVTDDDITGTFTFLRALEDYGSVRALPPIPNLGEGGREGEGSLPPLPNLGEGGRGGEGLTPAQCGQTWLNYLIEEKCFLWWGGMGQATGHTAYLRLKRGISAPESGSIATNGPIVAQQIGAQIFGDGWAMV